MILFGSPKNLSPNNEPKQDIEVGEKITGMV